MAKQKERFAFRCADKPEALRERLKSEIKLVPDRVYLIEETDGGFDLGIGRGGHGAGYWYCATVEPDGDGSIIRGRIVHRRWDGKETRLTAWDRIEGGCLFVILLPLVLIVSIYRFFRPEVTMEDQFVEFMSEQMHCQLIE